MYQFLSLLVGLLFGIGLIIAGMANPVKVLNFLDLAGKWDPSLVFVMIGAIFVSIFAFFIAKRRTRSFLGEAFHLPKTQHIDKKLILGSFTFGIGWGLVGFCPGPALVALGAGKLKAAIFVIAMLIGMSLFELLNKKQK